MEEKGTARQLPRRNSAYAKQEYWEESESLEKSRLLSLLRLFLLLLTCADAPRARGVSFPLLSLQLFLLSLHFSPILWVPGLFCVFRFAAEKHYEWLESPESLLPLLLPLLRPSMLVLTVGCGNSELSDALVASGMPFVFNLDFSRTVLQAKRRHERECIRKYLSSPSPPSASSSPSPPSSSSSPSSSPSPSSPRSPPLPPVMEYLCADMTRLEFLRANAFDVVRPETPGRKKRRLRTGEESVSSLLPLLPRSLPASAFSFVLFSDLLSVLWRLVPSLFPPSAVLALSSPNAASSSSRFSALLCLSSPPVGDCRVLFLRFFFFSSQIDKAAMDALMTEEGSVWEPRISVRQAADGYLAGVGRCLKPGGLFIQITFQQPHFR
ncbi:putative transmembrane protein, partial [Toxoplasma gondii p89]